MKSSATSARTLLFLPADRLQRLPKALASGAHLVVVDLEDAVAPGAKAAARAALLAQWPALDAAARTRIAVRINATGSPWHGDDLALLGELGAHGLAAAMLPKTESPAQLHDLAAAVPALPLLPLVESAEGLAALDHIARAPAVARLVFGHLDFQLDLDLQCSDDERELDAVRLAFASASRRAGLAGPVDGVTTQIDPLDRLQFDTARARRFGFAGKLCIHPNQVPTVNELLGPTPAQRAWAQRLLAAAASAGSGAFQFEGTMVDAPVLTRAQRLLDSLPD